MVMVNSTHLHPKLDGVITWISFPINIGYEKLSESCHDSKSVFLQFKPSQFLSASPSTTQTLHSYYTYHSIHKSNIGWTTSEKTAQLLEKAFRKKEMRWLDDSENIMPLLYLPFPLKIFQWNIQIPWWSDQTWILSQLNIWKIEVSTTRIWTYRDGILW